MTRRWQLPQEFVAEARRRQVEPRPTVTAADAATVVLLRDGAEGVEVYLLRRKTSMSFAAGMYVFPGGGVDTRDGDADLAWSGQPRDAWAAALEAGADLAASLVCAAVRETFEESGVLLAGPGATTVVDDTTGDDWEADRIALIDRSLAFAEMLRRRGLVLRADLLRAWAHWITPEVEPRRYDTRFFVAALPRGQRTRDVGGEADRVAWMRPADALDRFHRGDLQLLPPTATTLAEVAPYATADAVLAAADARVVRPILPEVVLTDDGADLLVPGHAETHE